VGIAGQRSPTERTDDEEEPYLVEVPELKGLTIDEAGAMLDTKGLLMKLVGKEGIIKDQVPKAGVQVPLQTSIIVYLEDLWAGEIADRVYLPDLKGMTIREASDTLSSYGLKVNIKGDGFCVTQDPPAGSKVKPGSIISLRFKPNDDE
jgi:stage V sporulation protein D (sporulation-specific penicillin-binding protein)